MKQTYLILTVCLLLLSGLLNFTSADMPNPGSVDEAHKEFIRLITPHANRVTADSLWKEAAENYNGRDRHYHTLEHIGNFYSQLKKCKSQIKDWESLVLAMVYHDIIYGSADHRDEERSAELAVARLTMAYLPSGKIDKIKTLVLATKAHAASADSDINYFNDADMSIVGLDRAYYKQYVANVRKEYANSPNFNTGRKTIMKNFLAMPRIFKTDFFYALYEQPARENISWEISTLIQHPKHVILISIDGFRPDFYLDSLWPAPNLQHMAKLGAAANGVQGIFPSVTYPSHTSIITGAYPAEHGIYYNTPLEPAGASGLWNSETKLIKAQTLWSAVKSAGKVTASVSWPVSVGADVDYNIPEAFVLSTPLDRREPTSRYATPKGLFEEVQLKATGQMEAIDLNINYSKMDENLGRIAAYLFRTYRPALLTLHLPGVDHAQHAEGRKSQLIRSAIANADRAVASMLETVRLSGMGDSTAIIVTGDHGFVDVKQTFSPNVLLAQAGLLDAKEGPTRRWKAFFQTSSGSAFLHLKEPNDQETLKKVIEIITQQPDSIKQLYRFITKDNLVKSGADPHASFALAASKGVAINARADGALTGIGKGGAHGYFPDFAEIETGFVGYGTCFAKGIKIEGMRLVDIAPLVATMLEVPFHKSANSRIISNILD